MTRRHNPMPRASSLVHRQQLLEKSANLSLPVDKVHFQYPVALVAPGVGFTQELWIAVAHGKPR
jgi:hypothetical protein